MITFDEFSEMLERNCFNSWRTSIGRSNNEVIESVNAVIFTRNDNNKDGTWEFSFALRIGNKWYQAVKIIDRVEYDIYNPPSFDDMKNGNVKCNMSPQNIASSLAIDLLSDIDKKIGIG